MVSKVTKLFNDFKKRDVLEDRSEYDADDLKSTYPQLSEKESKLLYLRLRKWRKTN